MTMIFETNHSGQEQIAERTERDMHGTTSLMTNHSVKKERETG